MQRSLIFLTILLGAMSPCLGMDPNIVPVSAAALQLMPHDQAICHLRCLLEKEEKQLLAPWRVGQFWTQLFDKMNDQQIRDLLGTPIYEESTASTTIWYYQEAPHTLESGATVRPRNGLLTFKKCLVGDQEQLMLKSWKFPDWQKTWMVSPVQYTEQQNRIASYKQQIQIRQLQLEQEKKKAEEAARLAAEQKARAEQAAQLAAERQAAEQAKNQWQNIPRKYYYMGGGAVVFLGLCFLLGRQRLG